MNFAGVDRHGASLTTGWEAINAIVTMSSTTTKTKVTTLTFSSDYAAFLQTSVDELKRILKIRALQVVTLLESNFFASGQTIEQSVRCETCWSMTGQS